MGKLKHARRQGRLIPRRFSFDLKVINLPKDATFAREIENPDASARWTRLWKVRAAG